MKTKLQGVKEKLLQDEKEKLEKQRNNGKTVCGKAIVFSIYSKIVTDTLTGEHYSYDRPDGLEFAPKDVKEAVAKYLCK